MNKFIKFTKDVVFTTAVAFLLITFLFIGLTAAFDDNALKYERYVFMGFILWKLFCIFLFSLSLGFINRIFDTKLSKFGKRIVHFVLSSVSFIVFMVLLFDLKTLTGDADIEAKNIFSNYIVFLVLDFVTVGVCALARKLFKPRVKEEYKPMVNDEP